MNATQESFVSIHSAAYELGVPLAWLKREAEVGRVPSLKVGRRLLFNVQQVEQVLTARANADLAMLDIGQAAQLLDVPQQFLQRLVERQAIPCYPIPETDEVLFDRGELHAWLRQIRQDAEVTTK